MSKILKEKEDIIFWLTLHSVKNYTLIPDVQYGFKIDVKENVFLSSLKLKFIPVKFNEISGCFDCSSNQLASLEFCPVTVTKGFTCSRNRITSLKDCPQNVGEGFSCSHNSLTSLEFCPKKIHGEFRCDHNYLENLEFCPEVVMGEFSASYNKLNSMVYFPKQVDGDLNLLCNPLIEYVQNLYLFKDIQAAHLEDKKIKDIELLAEKLNDELVFNPTQGKKIKL